MTSALLLSFGVIFAAELGDKSQLIALAFAQRYRWQVVAAGLCAATVLVFAISVTVGHYLGATLPHSAVAIASGTAFLATGLWSLRIDADDDTAPAARSASAFLVVTSAFLLAEFGDKTMFASIGLAATHQAFAVWLGSTLAMLAADGLALALGMFARRHLPEGHIRLAAALGFLYAGSWTLLTGLAPTVPTAVAGTCSAIIPAAVLVVRRRRVTAVADQPSISDERSAVHIPAARDHFEDRRTQREDAVEVA